MGDLIESADGGVRYPVGVRDFEKLREEGYFYADKTALIARLVSEGSSYFFCRPRYFGKSLLLSAMEAYFSGRQDLFAGLSIASSELAWQEYTVIRVDFSSEVFSKDDVLESFLDSFLSSWEERLGITRASSSFSQRFASVIRGAYESSGKPVVVLVDDYDKPVLDAVFSPLETHNKEVVRSFLSALNGCDYFLKFVFVTGITKYESVNIFNGSSQLRDISLSPEYESLCGFTREELGSLCSEDEVAILSELYGGYRFSKSSFEYGCEILNPFSVLNSLASGDYGPFWVQTGSPVMMSKMLVSYGCDLLELMCGVRVDADDLMEYRWTDRDMTSLLFQAGYLGISAYDADDNLFTLSFPNKEVERAFCKSLLPYFTVIGSLGKCGAELALFRKFLCDGDMPSFVNHFVQAFSKEAVSREKKRGAGYALMVAFLSIVRLTGFSVGCASSSDVVVRLPLSDGGGHYIFCMRLDKGLPFDDVVQDALECIGQKDYLSMYPPLSDGAVVRKVVMVFSSRDASLAGWKEE